MIIKTEFTSGEYFVAKNSPFKDPELSWEAKGVLAYLFSQSENWTPRIYDIVKHGPTKKYTIKKVFKELENLEYLHRRKIRKEDGTFDWEVKVFDHPRSDPGWTRPTPDANHPGRDGGANKNNNQQISTTNKKNREGARTREDADTSTPPPDEDADTSTPADEEDTDTPVEIHQKYFGAVRLSIGQKESIRQKVDDLELWDEVVEWWMLNDFRGRSVGRMLARYEEQKAERQPTSGDGDGVAGVHYLTAGQKKNDSFEVVDGRVHYEGESMMKNRQYLERLFPFAPEKVDEYHEPEEVNADD